MTSMHAVRPSNRVAIPGRDKRFSSPKHPDRTCVPPTHPRTQWVSVAVFFLGGGGIKQPVCENDYSSPSSSEVKNVWSFSSVPYAYVA